MVQAAHPLGELVPKYLKIKIKKWPSGTQAGPNRAQTGSNGLKRAQTGSNRLKRAQIGVNWGQPGYNGVKLSLLQNKNQMLQLATRGTTCTNIL